MKFIGRNDAEVRIVKLPPPLTSDHSYMNRTGRFGRRLHIIDCTNRGQNQDEHDQYRERRPGKFDLVAGIWPARLFHDRRDALLASDCVAVAWAGAMAPMGFGSLSAF